AARRTLDELVDGLDPVASGGGLEAAVTRLAQAAGHVVRTTGRIPRDLDDALARAIWFACAEALANIGKHAPDAHATIALGIQDSPRALVLTVTDDGPGGADPRGSGLAGLADRLAMVGGELEIRSNPGVGTAVAVRVPLGSGPAPAPPQDGALALVPAGVEQATVEI
ncbi:MAG: ATP-binding protein, partial [Nocardioides sp.]|uniref:sensor histidine kinase n=1 Tax=Nocardioides sp. TaxID=35761 RepID=UPI0032638B5D